MGGTQLDKADIISIRGLGGWVDDSSSDEDPIDDQSGKTNSDSSLREQAPQLPVRSWVLNNQMGQTPREVALPSLTQQDTVSTVSGALDSSTSTSHHDNPAAFRSSYSVTNMDTEDVRKQAAMIPCGMASESSSDPLASNSTSSDPSALDLRDEHFQSFSPSPSTESSASASDGSVNLQVSSPITEASLESDESGSRPDWDMQSNSSFPLPVGSSNIPTLEIPYQSLPVDHRSPTDSDGSERESAPPTREEERNQNEQVSSNRTKKRTLTGQSGDHENDHDGLTGNKVKRVKTGDSTEDQDDRILACPYYKKGPIRYRKCHGYVLKKISYVKQHLLRHHQLPIHCPRCMSVFTNDEDVFDHIRALSCEERPVSERPEGMTSNQLKQLRGTRANQKQTESEQWYEIFTLLFPGAELPSSPYVNKEHSEDMSSYIEFMEREGGNIIRETLRGRLALCDSDDEIVRDTINDAIQQIYRAYSQVMAENMATNPKDARNEVQGQTGDQSGIQSTNGPRKHVQGERDAASHIKTGSKGGNHSAVINKEADNAKGIRASDETEDRGIRVDDGQSRKAETMSWEQSRPEGSEISSVNILAHHGKLEN